MFTFDVAGRVRHVHWIVVRATPQHGIGRPSLADERTSPGCRWGKSDTDVKGDFRHDPGPVLVDFQVMLRP